MACTNTLRTVAHRYCFVLTEQVYAIFAGKLPAGFVAMATILPVVAIVIGAAAGFLWFKTRSAKRQKHIQVCAFVPHGAGCYFMTVIVASQEEPCLPCPCSCPFLHAPFHTCHPDYFGELINRQAWELHECLP